MVDLVDVVYLGMGQMEGLAFLQEQELEEGHVEVLMIYQELDHHEKGREQEGKERENNYH